MQAVGSLRHPAIVQATDGGEVDGIHFLVMELYDGVDGGALIQFLRSVAGGGCVRDRTSSRDRDGLCPRTWHQTPRFKTV